MQKFIKLSNRTRTPTSTLESLDLLKSPLYSLVHQDIYIKAFIRTRKKCHSLSYSVCFAGLEENEKVFFVVSMPRYIDAGVYELLKVPFYAWFSSDSEQFHPVLYS